MLMSLDGDGIDTTRIGDLKSDVVTVAAVALRLELPVSIGVSTSDLVFLLSSMIVCAISRTFRSSSGSFVKKFSIAD